MVVEVVEELGSDANVFFRVDAPRVSAEAIEAAVGGETLLAESVTLFAARVDARTSARVGGRLTVAVDPSRFHFFDPETGMSLVSAPEPSVGEELAVAPATSAVTAR